MPHIASAGQSLYALYPELCKEWDYEKNIFSPMQLKAGAKIIAHWICSKNPEHKWYCIPLNRIVKKQKCPFCSNRKACSTNSLLFTHPELCKEWDYGKNKINPNEVTAHFSAPAHWICSKNTEHKWESRISNRAINGSGCIYCLGKKACSTNSLLFTHPELCKEWDYGKNKINPNEVTAGSHKHAHWICSKNSEHKWISSVCNRVKGPNCPFCINKKIHPSNSLLFTHPELCEEWDYGKNKINPNEVTAGSHKNTYWICSFTTVLI